MIYSKAASKLEMSQKQKEAEEATNQGPKRAASVTSRQNLTELTSTAKKGKGRSRSRSP